MRNIILKSVSNRFLQILFIFVFALLVAPSQSHAAWWNFPSWFSENQQQQLSATSSDIVSGVQAVNQGVVKTGKKEVISPLNNSKSSDAKTIEDLRVEVATLKTSLDNLEKRFSDLQKGTSARFSAEESDISPRVIALERVADASQSLETRIKGIEQKVTGLSNVSANTGSIQVKNYDVQISEIAKRVNALIHINTSDCISRFNAVAPKERGDPSQTADRDCPSIFSDLNY